MMPDASRFNKAGMVLFVLIFLLLAFGVAFALSRLVSHYGILVSPKFLTWIAILGVMIALGMNYLTPWHGLFFNFFLAKPTVSLSRDILGVYATDRDDVCGTVNGFRFFFCLDLPFQELPEQNSSVRNALVPLLTHNLSFSVYLYEVPRAAALFALDEGIEPELVSLLAAENRRLASLQGKGVVTFIVSVEIPRLAMAGELLAEIGMKAVRPFPWRTLADGFFPPGLFDQPGVIAPSKAFSVPAFVENEAGRFVPLMLQEFREGYATPRAHTRLQAMAYYLGVPVLWQIRYQPCHQAEYKRLHLLTNLQRLWPPGLLAPRLRGERDEAPARLRELELALTSPDKPAFIHQAAWLAVGDQDHRVLFRRAREWFARMQIDVRGAVPASALKLYLSLHPGAENAAASVPGFRPQLPAHEEFLAEVSALANWTGHAAPTIVQEDETGKAFPFSLFGDGVNFNLSLVGESGSGKSVFLAGLVAGHLAQSRYNRAIIVDYGGSFDGLIQALRGRQISHDDLRTLKFSPIPAFKRRWTAADECVAGYSLA